MGRLILHTSIVIILVLWNAIGNAQNDPIKTALLTEIPSEKVILKSNDSLMLSGETLYYDFYCINTNAFSTISKIGYVELIDANKVVIFKHKLNLHKGRAAGDFFVPSSLKTGHYKLIAYTQWSLNNKKDAFDNKNLYIINPFINAYDNNLKKSFGEAEPYVELSKTIEKLDPLSDGSSRVALSTNKTLYDKRQKVTLQIKNNGPITNYGSYTLSVKKRDAISITQNNSSSNDNNFKHSQVVLPDLRGELISGKVLTTSGQPIENTTVSLSVPGNDLVFMTASTNNEGTFYFSLTENFINATVYFQRLDAPDDDYRISVDHRSFDAYEALKFYPLKLNKNIADWIAKQSVFNQIESAYYNLKQDNIYETPSVIPFYGNPDLVYVLDDYTRFKSVRETFVEVVQQAAIRTEGEGYKFVVSEDETISTRLFDNASPLVLFNGLHTLDEKLVVEYDPGEIQSVSIVKGTFVDDSKVYNGIIDIRLKDPTMFNFYDKHAYTFDLKAAIKQKDYFQQSYASPKTHTPDFRTQLLWMPKMTLETSIQDIEFYTSDVPGNYEITLEGVTNQGEKIHVRTFIDVK